MDAGKFKLPAIFKQGLKPGRKNFNPLQYLSLIDLNTTFSYLSITFFGLMGGKFTSALILFLATDYKAAQISNGVNNSLPGGGGRQAILREANQQVNVMDLMNGYLFQKPPLEAVAEETPEELKHFILIGTLEGHISYARAVIRLIDNSEPPKEYAIGERIGPIKLIAIGREKVWVLMNGEKVKIEVGESSQQISTTPTDATGDTVSVVLSRQEVNDILQGDINKIYVGAAFGPNLVNGQIDGYKIHRVNDGHIFYRLGARSGDIIKSVNGYSLTDTEQMFELWRNVKTMPRIEVVIDRAGKQMKFDFQIRN